MYVTQSHRCNKKEADSFDISAKRQNGDCFLCGVSHGAGRRESGPVGSGRLLPERLLGDTRTGEMEGVREEE